MLMKHLVVALLLLSTGSLTFVTASARQTDQESNERAFEEAVAERTSPFSIHVHDYQKLLMDIENYLATGSIRAEVKGRAVGSAALFGDVKLLQLLIRYGANVNQTEEDRGTALMAAAAVGFYVQCGNDPLETSYRGNTDAVRALLEAGARIDVQNPGGETALMLAARNARSASVQLLLKAGANVNVTNVHGQTALMYAVQSSGHYDERNLKEIVMGLISGGANLNARDDQGKTALSYTPQMDALAKLLIESGAIE